MEVKKKTSVHKQGVYATKLSFPITFKNFQTNYADWTAKF